MNWETKRIKDVIQLKARIGWKGLRSDEFQTKSYAYLVTGQDFNSAEIEWSECYQIDKERYEEDPYIQLENGDVLVTKDGTIGKVAMVANLDKPACLNSGVFVLHQKKNYFLQKYLFWQLSSSVFKEFIRENSDGSTIQHLYQNVFDLMNVIIPPDSTQQKIADFLDAKTQNIDARIEIMEKKRELYITLRKALINEAVNGEGKGWKKRRIKELFKIIGSGSTPDSNVESYYDENGYNWLQTGDLNDGIISSTSKKITDSAIQRYSTLKTYKKGSLVVAMYGATIGKVGLLDIDTTTNQACCVMSEPKEIDAKFMFYWFLSNKEFIISRATGGGQPNIGQDTIKFFEIEHPNLDEQQKIVSYLDKKTSAIDLIVSSITKEIDSLKTYRRALINEAVTGKLKIE